MTRETLPKDQSEDAPDVFDMDLARETTQPHDATPAGIRVESANGGGILAKIGPRHFVGLSFVIAVVWIAWPEKSRAPSTTSSSVLNTQLRSVASPSIPTATDRTGASIAQSTAPGNPPAAAIGSMPRAMPTPTAELIIQAQAQQAAALIAAIDDLGARLVVVETRLSGPEKSSLASPQQPENDNNKPRPKRYPPNERTRTSADKAAAPRLAGYSLNTIYATQAWIVRDGHLTLVQQGDVVDDFEVIRIDARDHQVLTSRGIIR